MKKLLFLAVFLVGCHSAPNTMVMCTAAAGAIDTLAIKKDSLTDDQIAKVNDAMDALTPVCGEGEKPYPSQSEQERAATAAKVLQEMANES